MKPQQLTVEKFINGGFGLGRLDSGQVVLCRHVLPGENVIVTIGREKKNHLFGALDQILSPHPARISAPCPYFGQCGGCSLQHCDYPAQLELKQEILQELLNRQALEGNFDLRPILPSPGQFGYRQRIRLQLGNRGELGFHRHESHDLVAVKTCLLASPELNSTLSRLLQHQESRTLLKLATELELADHSITEGVVAIFEMLRKPRPADLKLAQRLINDIPLLSHIFFRGNDFPLTLAASIVAEPEADHFQADYPNINRLTQPLILSWEAGGFCQVNLDQNRKMIETVLEFCNPASSDRIADLYCGMGNFSIPLAMHCRELVGFEGQGAAIRAGRRNAERAALTNTLLTKSPVEKACKDMAERGEKFDITVIDPPRAGIPGLADDLARITLKKLVYISCDPATLCRDLSSLCAGGFHISTIQPLDMFPQTHHIETVVLLERNR